MPPRARLRLSVVARLERQLAFASAEAVRRAALQAERMVRQIQPDTLFSESWLVRSLTGIRTRDADDEATMVGQALVWDVAALAHRLSTRAPLSPESLAGGCVWLDQAARRLGVSVRSVQRWRRRGLASVQVMDGDRIRTAVSGDTLAWFMREVEPPREPVHHDRARQRRRTEVAAEESHGGGSLQQLARRVAARTGVSLATARRAVAAAERQGRVANAARRARVTAAHRAAAWRAWRRGTALKSIASRLSRSAAATLRLVRRERRDRLRALRTGVVPMATFTRVDASETLLAPASVRRGLSHEPWPGRARAFLDRFGQTDAPGASVTGDAKRLVALRYLLWRAECDVRGLRASDPGSAVEEVETLLRWAARLQLTLVERALPGAVARLRQVRGGPLATLSGASLRRACLQCVRASTEAVQEAMANDQATARVRLQALAAVVVERHAATAAWLRPGTASADADAALSDDLRDSCVPWAQLAPLRDDLAASARGSPLAGARLLVRRQGWTGEAPRSPRNVAAEARIDPRRAAQQMARAFRSLRTERT